MKVLHIIPSISPIRGGPSLAIIGMVKGLNSQGIQASIVTTNDNGPTQLDISTKDWINYQGVPVHFFSRYSPKNSAAIREFSYSSDLTYWLLNNIHYYDILHIHGIFSFPSTVAMAIARLKKVLYIVRPLGQLCHWSLSQKSIKKKTYLQLIEKKNLGNSQGMHFTSLKEEYEASSLSIDVPSFVIPHGLHTPEKISDATTKLRSHLQLSTKVPIITFLSRLHQKKGLEFLISALSNIRDYPFVFLIAGTGDSDYVSYLKSLIQEQKLSDRTHFLGFVEGEAKNILLQGSNIFALTSYSENFGIAVLESLAAGLPTLVTPGVALSQLINQHQFGYVPPLEETAISNALLHIFQNPEEAKQKGERARKFIQRNYTWDKIATDLIEVYQSILANQTLPSQLQSTTTI